MEFDAQNIKELLESNSNIIINDDLSEKDLQYIAGLAHKNDKKITIVAKKWHLEALKKNS